MLNTIFLIGYMGAGKSVVGKLLSQINGFNFYDLDEYIEANEGKKVSALFNHNNEVYFRKIENKYLKEIFLLKDNKIISTGGGTPCFQNNFEIIYESPNPTSIYLKANIDVLVNRLKDSIDNRPIISHLTDEYKLKEFITKHLFERNYYYEKSRIKIVTDNLEPTEIVKLIASKLA